MNQFKFELGDTVKDIITGFTGVIIVRSEYLNGCIRYGIQSKELKDGKTIDAEYFDEDQLEFIDSITPVSAKERTGGPRPAPKRQKDPHI